ncbi:MAG TPA: hypothetical protein DD827_03005 [Gammaproteobacteria bacterium]|nr:hypothetical protein [Gammaproteobacteria bacterium]
MSSSNNAVLDALVYALRVLRMDALISRMQEHWSVSLQVVICGLIFNHQRTTMIHKNKTTSNHLMTH